MADRAYVAKSKTGRHGETITVSRQGVTAQPDEVEVEPDPVADAERRFIEGELDEAELFEVERETRLQRLRRERDERKAAKDAEKQRKRGVTELEKELIAYAESDPLADARAKRAEAVAALDAWLDALNAHNGYLADATARATELAPHEVSRRGNVHLDGNRITTMDGRVRVGEHELRQVKVGDDVVIAVHDVLERKAPKATTGQSSGKTLCELLRQLIPRGLR